MKDIQEQIQDTLNICICIATFKRPQLLDKTLNSLFQLTFTKCETPNLRIIVVDNDAEKTAQNLVVRLASRAPCPLEYAVESKRGISFVRNRLVQKAMTLGAEYVAFVDDDETVDSYWLDELLFQAGQTGADAVLGPVNSVFEKKIDPWLVPFFERKRHADGDWVGADNFRTGNLLIATKSLKSVKGPFNSTFALSGGEDSFLGRTLETQGARFVWADNAVVFETVPPDRTTIKWVLNRQFRCATTLTTIRLKLHGPVMGISMVLFRTAGLVVLNNLQLIKSVKTGKKGLSKWAANWAYALGNMAGLVGVISNVYKDV